MPEKKPPPPPDRIFETLTAYQRTAALKTALELDLFTAIGEGDDAAPTLARRCAASERGMRSLCDYLVVQGLLSKGGNRYALPETSALYLDRRSERFVGDAVGFLNSEFLRRCFDGLTEAVRKGGTALEQGGTVAAENPVWVLFARCMEGMVRPVAEALAERAAGAGERVEKVLDVAAGHGYYGIEVARRCPGARVVALDWPAVLEVARENVAAAGLADRFHFLPGSAFDLDWGEGYDLVLLPNFLHHFDERACVELLRKTRRALRDGGRVAVLESVPNEDRVSPDRPAAFSLVLLATTPRGDAYLLSEYRAMVRAAGFGALEAHPLSEGLHQILVAKK